MADFEKAIIGFPDYGDTVTYSGGSYEADFPATNAGNPRMALVARTTDATLASTKITGTLASVQNITLAALQSPNISSTARIRWVLKDGSGVTLADSGFVDVFNERFAVETLDYEDERFWDGKLSQDALSFGRPPFLIRFDAQGLAKTFEVEIDDTSNPDGYVDIAYITVANERQLEFNPAPGAQYGFDGSRTRVRTAIGGAESFDRRAKAMVFRGTVRTFSRSEALDFRLELDRQMDVDRPFIWWPFPSETLSRQATAFIARNRRIGPLRHASSLLRDSEFPLDLRQVM